MNSGSRFSRKAATPSAASSVAASSDWTGANAAIVAASNAGVQETHYELARMRRYYRCVHLIERALGVSAEDSFIPPTTHELPDGWAIGFVPAQEGAGQGPDMKTKPFYWKAFTKEKCVYEPPEGSTKMVHVGDGRFEAAGTLGPAGQLVATSA